MDPVTISGIFSVATKLIDRLFPDKTAKEEAKLKLVEMQMNGELAQLASDTELAKGQMDINRVEAGSNKLFVSGWRPSVGWICSFSLGYNFLLQPFLAWGAAIYGAPIPPTVEISELMIVLGGLLGLGGYRTIERMKGVARAQ